MSIEGTYFGLNLLFMLTTINTQGQEFSFSLGCFGVIFGAFRL